MRFTRTEQVLGKPNSLVFGPKENQFAFELEQSIQSMATQLTTIEFSNIQHLNDNRIPELRPFSFTCPFFCVEALLADGSHHLRAVVGSSAFDNKYMLCGMGRKRAASSRGTSQT